MSSLVFVYVRVCAAKPRGLLDINVGVKAPEERHLGLIQVVVGHMIELIVKDEFILGVCVASVHTLRAHGTYS